MYIKANAVTCFFYDFGLEIQLGLHNMQRNSIREDIVLI